MWGALYKHHQFCKRVEIFFPPQQFVSAQGRGYKPVIQLQAQQGVQSCTKELQKNHPTSRKAGKAQNHLPEYLGSKICTEKSSQVCLWQKLEDATDEKCPMSNESLNPNQTKSLCILDKVYHSHGIKVVLLCYLLVDNSAFKQLASSAAPIAITLQII